uniref:Uncharacterized protein n=1 Tax=Arundo donax TaxID=35708 RepID=A0A0A9EIA1_ARUDO
MHHYFKQSIIRLLLAIISSKLDGYSLRNRAPQSMSIFQSYSQMLGVTVSSKYGS